MLSNYKAASVMRQIVKQTKRCDDNQFNYLINYFYSEFNVLSINQHIATKNLTVSLFKDASYWDLMKSCFATNAQLLGYYPLRKYKIYWTAKSYNMNNIDIYISFLKKTSYQAVFKSEEAGKKLIFCFSYIQDYLIQDQHKFQSPLVNFGIKKFIDHEYDEYEALE